MKLKLSIFGGVVASILYINSSFAQVVVQLGTPVTSSTSPLVNAYVSGFANDRKQFIVTAAELIAAGAPATGGEITHIGFYGINGTGSCNFNFTVGVKHTTLSSLSGTPLTNTGNWETGFTTLFSGSVNNASGVSGWRDRGGAGTFCWDGVSNILVQTCNNTGGCNSGANLTTVCSSYYTASGFSNSTRRAYSPGSGTACDFVPNSAGSYSYRNDRPVMRFTILDNTCFFHPDAGQDTTIFLGESVQIGSNPTSGYTYSWSPTAGLNDPNIANPIATPIETTTYLLTVEDAFSQTYIDSVTITVIPVLTIDAPISSTMEDSILLTPARVFDIIFDSYGNTYSLNSLRSDDDGSGSRTSCNAGYFNVVFESGCGMSPTGTQQEQDRAAVVCQVLSDISDFIVSPLTTSGETVNIWVRDISQLVQNPETSGVLGEASAFYVLPSGVPATFGIADNEIWKTIASGIDSYTGVASPLISSNIDPVAPANFFHGMMTFNFSNTSLPINWNTDMSTTSSSGLFDLYTVVLHEITHALGFASLIDNDGTSKFGTNFNYYSRYDMFLEDQNGINLIEGAVQGCPLYDVGFNPVLSPDILAPNPLSCVADHTTCGDAVIYSGSTTVPVYTPNCFEPPSSLSHFEDQCHPTGNPHGNNVYFNMSNANGMDVIKRFLQEEEKLVLCDLGYQTTATYGNNSVVAGSFKNYGTACTDLQVAGINDGITSGGAYAFIGSTGSPITITGILSNDFNATDFECLQPILGGGTVNITSGTAATSVTYTSATPGLKLLRYVPLNLTSGNRGNITYIYVYVTDANCNVSVCDLVNNGNFESVVDGCGHLDPSFPTTLNCWEPLSLTPEVFVRGCTDFSNNFNTGNGTYYSNPASDTYNGTPNDNFMGLWSSQYTTSYMSDGAQTLLSSPLIPAEDYVLSFWGKANNSIYTTASIPVSFASYPVLSLPMSINTITPITVIPDLVMLATSPTIPNDNAWHYFTIPFTFSGTASHDILAVYCQHLGANAPNANTYVFIDDVSILPSSEAVLLNLPDSICIDQQISNLSTHLSPSVQGGEFTGNGVTESNGIYSFDAATAGAGNHIITYTYTTALGCTLAVHGIIEVVDAPVVTVVASSDFICGTSSTIVTVTVTNNTAGNLSDIVLGYDLPSGIIMDNSGDFSNQSGTVFSTDPFSLGQGANTVLTFEISGDETILGIINNCIDVISAHAACDLPEACFEVLSCDCTTGTWPKHPASLGRNFGNGIATDDAGNYYITGTFTATSDFGTGAITPPPAEDLTLFAVKYTENCGADWVVTGDQIAPALGFHSSGGREIIADNAGNVYVTGTATTTSTGFDIVSGFLIKLDATDGSTIWAEFINSNFFPANMAIDPVSGDIYVVGEHNGEMAIVRYDSNGTLIWSDTYGSPAQDAYTGVAVDGNGEVYVSGYLGDDATVLFGLASSPLAGIFIGKYDDTGAKLWTIPVASSVGDVASDIVVDGSGSLYATGEFGIEAFIASYATGNGSLNWFDAFGAGTVKNGGTAIDFNAGNVAVTGYYRDMPEQDVFVNLYTGFGTPVFSVQSAVSPFGWGHPNDIVLSGNGESYITGEFFSEITFGSSTLTCPGGATNMFAARVDNLGVFFILIDENEEDESGDKGETNGLQNKNTAIRIFPNPASEQLNIQSTAYSIQNITLYDVTGKVLPSLFEESKGGVALNTRHLPKGLYFIEIELSDGSIEKAKFTKE